ncbi:MAG: hypothetical protein ACR2NK_08245 [Mariniblastus sp.]
MTIEVAAIPWYTSAKTYKEFQRSAEDATDFFPTFENWVDAATSHEREAESRGIPVVRIRMDTQTFAEFCLHSGNKNDGAGRTAFANDRADKFLGNKSDPL